MWERESVKVREDALIHSFTHSLNKCEVLPSRSLPARGVTLCFPVAISLAFA